MLESKVNASYIIQIAGLSRTISANFRKLLKPEDYEILRGDKNNQGTYVKIDAGAGLCRNYGLSELEKRLHSLEGLVVAADPSHARSQSQNPEQLLEPTGSSRASAQNEGAQSRVPGLDPRSSIGIIGRS